MDALCPAVEGPTTLDQVRVAIAVFGEGSSILCLRCAANIMQVVYPVAVCLRTIYLGGAMRTLYSILGLDSDATAQQIEQAYKTQLAKVEAELITDSERHNRLVALSETYSVLSNPVTRKAYDQKLLTNAASTFYAGRNEDGPRFRYWVGLLVGVSLVASVYLFSEKATERERLRIEHEREVQLRAQQLEEERQRDRAERLAQAQAKADLEATSRQLRMDQQQYERDTYVRRQQEYQRQQMEEQKRRQEYQRQQMEEQNRRQEQARAQQRLQADKRYLQQLEREHYGRVITQ